MDTIRNALIDTEKSIVKLFNSGDVKGILAYFNTEFVGFSSTRHERLTGLSQLKKHFCITWMKGKPLSTASTV